MSRTASPALPRWSISRAAVAIRCSRRFCPPPPPRSAAGFLGDIAVERAEDGGDKVTDERAEADADRRERDVDRHTPAEDTPGLGSGQMNGASLGGPPSRGGRQRDQNVDEAGRGADQRVDGQLRGDDPAAARE